MPLNLRRATASAADGKETKGDSKSDAKADSKRDAASDLGEVGDMHRYPSLLRVPFSDCACMSMQDRVQRLISASGRSWRWQDDIASGYCPLSLLGLCVVVRLALRCALLHRCSVLTAALRAAMARELAERGFRTPVVVAAGGCAGEPATQMLLTSISDALDSNLDSKSSEETKLSADLLTDLLESGCLAVIVDGVNEIPTVSHLMQFANQINELTKPTALSARSLWIVSSRKYDYHHFGRGMSRLPLPLTRHLLPPLTVTLDHLEKSAFELQPLMFGKRC